MEKKKKRLLYMTGILLLLLVVLFGVQFWNQKQAEKQEEETEAAKIYVTDLDDVSEISYNVGQGDFTFAKREEGWVYTEDSEFPLKQDIPEQMIETFGKLEAQRELKEGDEPEAYGLEEPVYTVRLTTADGKSTVLDFGNAVNDSYYVKVEDTEPVYTVSATVIQELQYTMDELAQFDQYPSISSGNLLKETITENGKTTTYDSENEDDAKDIAAVAGGLGAVTLNSAADYSVSDQDLSKYGLDDQTRITVKAVYTEGDMEEELSLYIGKENGADKRYVMVNDSRIVYLISTAVCDNILNVPEE